MSGVSVSLPYLSCYANIYEFVYDVLLICRYLVQNLDWLQDLLTEYSDDDYFIFDCPGTYDM